MSPLFKCSALSVKFPVQPNGTEAFSRSRRLLCEAMGLAWGMDIWRAFEGERMLSCLFARAFQILVCLVDLLVSGQLVLWKSQVM